MFGVSTIIGPLLGGFFVDNLTWRWIFYVNLPIGVLAFVVIGAVFHAPTERREHAIDFLGAGLLAAGLAGVVLYTSLGGTTYAWSSPGMIALLAAGTLSLVAFLLVESRVPEPILPLALFRNRVFAVTSAVGFIIGLALFGAITYLPVYLQLVKAKSPTVSGLLLTPMMGGLLVTSILSGQLISRFGRYRTFPIAGTAITACGLALLSTLALRAPFGARGSAAASPAAGVGCAWLERFSLTMRAKSMSDGSPRPTRRPPGDTGCSPSGRWPRSPAAPSWRNQVGAGPRKGQREDAVGYEVALEEQSKADPYGMTGVADPYGMADVADSYAMKDLRRRGIMESRESPHEGSKGDGGCNGESQLR